MNILIIEDEPSIRETLQDLLELNGHEVMVAADGGAGVTLAKTRPDLILCDIGLPDIDGYQVIESIRATPACADIPFIFLTARASRDEQRQGMSLGADDYITKPFTESEIVAAIAARIKRQKPLKERVEKLLTERLSTVGAKWSHELKMPLNGILAGIELIEAEADRIQPFELKALLGLIRTSAQQQQDLSRKLLFHYDLERRKRLPAPKKTFRCSAVAAVESAAKGAAKKAGREGDLMLSCEAAEVAMLDGLLVAAISELVENAFHFSKPGQIVSVIGEREADVYRIEVWDFGVGMTAEECAAVGPFAVFTNSEGGKQGLGLGLSLAKTIVELAGGRLVIRPREDECGVHVQVDVPCVS